MKYIYLISSQNEKYKVGITANVGSRLKTLNTSNPDALKVITTKLVNYAYKVESQIHEKYKNKKTNGGNEWFNLEPLEVLEVCVMIHKSEGVLEMIKKDKIAILAQRMSRFEEMQNRTNELIKAIGKGIKFKKPEVFKTVKPRIEDKELIELAKKLILKEKRASASFLQSRLKIGYVRAYRIMSELEKQKVVGSLNGAKPREILK